MRLAVFDAGGTFIKCALMEDGEILERWKVPTPAADQKEFLNAIKTVLAKMGEVQGISLSLPGRIDSQNRKILSGGAIACNDGADLDAWQEIFGLPLEAENDARCAALAEMKSGSMQDVENGIVLVLGTGVGSSLILNHALYGGSHQAAGETSMILTSIPDTVDYSPMFGLKGSGSSFVQRVAGQFGLEANDGPGAFEKIRTEPEAAKMFESYCRDLAFQIFNIQCLLDLEQAAIGGGISQDPLLVNEIRRQYDKIYEEYQIGHPKLDIVSTAYFNDANLIGAWENFQARHSEERRTD